MMPFFAGTGPADGDSPSELIAAPAGTAAAPPAATLPVDGGSPSELIAAPAGAAAAPPAAPLPVGGGSSPEPVITPAGEATTSPVEPTAGDIERYEILIATVSDFGTGWPQTAATVLSSDGTEPPTSSRSKLD